MSNDVDITKTRWGDDTFLARYRHFFALTDPSNCLKSNHELDVAKAVVSKYKEDGVLPSSGEEGLWKAKYVHDSAFHPETGDKQNILGRMSFQVPGGMLITGILMAFYKSPLEIFLGQWLNQSFNALVNFTNRSGDKPLPNSVIMTAYITATSFATATSIGMNKVLGSKAPPLVGRFVPFMAVAVANMVNIPCMRQQELKEGVVVYDEDGSKLGNSPIAARTAITKVTISRICIAAPGMLLTPILMERLEKMPRFRSIGKWQSCAIQTVCIGCFLVAAVPFGCALYPQKQSISVDKLETELQESIRAKHPERRLVYYNKGL